MVNLTLSSYFVTYAVGLLFWGCSAKSLAVSLFYSLASQAIWWRAYYVRINSIEQLIGARIFQAFAGSAITVIATAIVKDLYDGREREKIMATIMSLVIIALHVAPVFGAFLLKIASWRMMFVTLAVFGIRISIGACYRETLESKYLRLYFPVMGEAGRGHEESLVHKVCWLFSPSQSMHALMGFLAAGSYIYINDFGLTEQQFSYAFAFNALCASFGPTLYMKLSVLSIGSKSDFQGVLLY